MRVAFNVEQLLVRPSGGIGRYTAELTRLWSAPSADLELIPFVAAHRRRSIDTAAARFGLVGLEVTRLPVPRPLLYDLWHLLGRPGLGTLSARLRSADLVHAPSLAVPPRGAAPLVVTVNDAAPASFPETSTWRGRWFHERGAIAAAGRADVVIAPSRAAADELTELTPIRPEQIRVVAHGVRAVAVTEREVVEARRALALGTEPYVLWVGTLEPRKDLPVLLDAFREVLRAGLPHRLVLAGPRGWGPDDAGAREVVQGLGERLRVAGPVSEDRLHALYRGADVFAFPSRHEGFGIPVLEAMAQGTAVVCSDIPVLREVAGDSAVFVPVGDVAAWAGALREVLDDGTLRARLGRQGLEWAGRWTWERCARSTLEVYREVLAR